MEMSKVVSEQVSQHCNFADKPRHVCRSMDTGATGMVSFAFVVVVFLKLFLSSRVHTHATEV